MPPDDDIAWAQVFRNVSPSCVGFQAQIRQLFVAAIDNGHLSAGQRLPSSRRLAAILGTARNTVTSAYEQLAEEGSLLAQQRNGVFVSRLATPPQVDPDAWPKPAAQNWQPDFAIRPSGLPYISKPRDSACCMEVVCSAGK